MKSTAPAKCFMCACSEAGRDVRRVMMLEEEEERYRSVKQADKEKKARGAQGQKHKESS